ncbi:unnamed protein product [Rangifer tarandus platyrhynchus]|uniref:Uncharacterized protein n=1 Tax=Rangifer tarandus platyrhynchus TaxID=3082113 RepID=A0ABN8ZLA5_RANTA|nr:unnamed protein product [Rangifer tarandus platyrhynchus]
MHPAAQLAPLQNMPRLDALFCLPDTTLPLPRRVNRKEALILPCFLPGQPQKCEVLTYANGLMCPPGHCYPEFVTPESVARNSNRQTLRGDAALRRPRTLGGEFQLRLRAGPA